MMDEAEFTTCAFCPRLCRHVCPVAVATGMESATAAAMMTVPLLHARGALSAADALAGTSLCLGCGACTQHCKVHVPVAGRLSGWRADHAERVVPMPLAPVLGSETGVCILTGAHDWSGAWAAQTGQAVARMPTSDSLGHTAWKQGDLGVLAAVAAHLAGREVVTGSGAVAEVARAAGLVVHRLAEPPGALRFVSCHVGPAPGPDQLACCGRREGFPEREPEAAQRVAAENVRLLAGRAAVIDDEECACWLRAHGADVVGPFDTSNPGVPDVP
jgi:ferredoxin